MNTKLLVLFIGVLSMAVAKKTMSSGARGQLICSNKPLAGAEIELYADKTGKVILDRCCYAKHF